MKPALKMPPPGFDDLATGDQLEYLFALWGRVLAQQDALPVPDWHRQVVAERLAEYRAGTAVLHQRRSPDTWRGRAK